MLRGRGDGQPLVQPLAHLVRLVLATLTLVSGDEDAGRGHADGAGEACDLQQTTHGDLSGSCSHS